LSKINAQSKLTGILSKTKGTTSNHKLQKASLFDCLFDPIDNKVCHRTNNTIQIQVSKYIY